MSSTPSSNQLMQVSTQAIYDCQASIAQLTQRKHLSKGGDKLGVDQTQQLLKLMKSLVDTKNQLSKEVEAKRVSHLDSKIVNEMESAIENAILLPIDVKVSQIYLSIFGLNTPLWQVLREVQTLLQTVEFLKNPRGKRVAKVSKKNRERRKKPHEKDSMGSHLTEE